MSREATATEILNINRHVERLVLKALNRFKHSVPAASALGIDTKQLYHLRRKFEIEQDYQSKQFIIKKNSNGSV